MTTTLTSVHTTLSPAQQRSALESVLGGIDIVPLSGALSGHFLAYAQGFRLSGSQPHSATYEELEGRGISEDEAISALFALVAQEATDHADEPAARDGVYVRLASGGRKIGATQDGDNVTGFTLTPHVYNFGYGSN